LGRFLSTLSHHRNSPFAKRWTGISPETHPYKDATSSQDQLLATHRNRQANHLGQQHVGGQKLLQWIWAVFPQNM